MTRSQHSFALAIGLLLATMTALRLPGLPLGPGELLLAILVAWLTLDAIKAPRLQSAPPTAKVMAGFWGLSLLVLAAGAWMGYRHGVVRHALLAHDGLAYLFVSGCSLALAWRANESARVAEADLHWLTYCMVCVGSFLWGYSLLKPQLLGVELWYGGVGTRFSGLSINPNQTAFMLALTPFLVMHCVSGLLSRRSNPIYPASLIILGAVAIAAGWETDSGALRLAWAVSIPVMVVTTVFLAVRGRAARQTLRELSLLAAMLILALLSVVLARASYPAGSEMVQSQAIVLQASDMPVRLALWTHGWEALMTSPWFGLGPGSFSGLAKPFLGSEAHNSVIDWGTNAGMVGIVVFAVFLLWLAQRMLLAGQAALFAGLLALATFGLAHHILRHPLLWAWLVLAAQVSVPRTRRTSETTCAV